MPHLNNKQKIIQTQSPADRITTSLSLAHHRKNKQTNKNSAQISLWRKLTHNTRPTSGRKKTKEERNQPSSRKELKQRKPLQYKQHTVQDTSYKQQTTQKYKPSHQQTGPHLALPIRGKTKKYLADISPYTKLTQTTAPTLEWQKPKGKKNSTLKSGKRRPQTQTQ